MTRIKRTRRREYELNDLRIKNEYVRVLRDEKRLPTQAEISRELNLRKATICEHLKNMDISEIVRPLRVFTSDVMLGIVNKAIKGDDHAARLFFALAFGWSEKQRVEGELATSVTTKEPRTLAELLETYRAELEELERSGDVR